MTKKYRTNLNKQQTYLDNRELAVLGSLAAKLKLSQSATMKLALTELANKSTDINI